MNWNLCHIERKQWKYSLAYLKEIIKTNLSRIERKQSKQISRVLNENNERKSLAYWNGGSYSCGHFIWNL